MEQRVDERRLAVVDVRDDRDVAEVVASVGVSSRAAQLTELGELRIEVDGAHVVLAGKAVQDPADKGVQVAASCPNPSKYVFSAVYVTFISAALSWRSETGASAGMRFVSSAAMG